MLSSAHTLRRSRALVGAAAFAGVVAWGPSARGELSRVWVVDDGTKVKPNELAHPLAAKNGTFESGRVRLFGLRNETVAFQVILEGGAAVTRDVSLSLPRVGPIANRVADAQAYQDLDAFWLDRRIDIFEQRYVEVTVRSHDMSWKPWSDAQPADLSGRIPDPLVPHLRPIEVAPKTNQGMWIDVYIPKNAPAGLHQGELEVRVDGQPFTTLEVTLEVADTMMPDTTSTKTMVWFSGGENNRDVVAARYFDDPWKATLEQMAALRRRHFFLARRHRITLFIGEDKSPQPEMHARLDGSFYARELGYDGPGVSVPQDVYSIHTYGGALTPAEAEMWTEWFDAHAPGTERFLYVIDEPHDAAKYPELNAIASAARPVPSFVTHVFDERLAFDIFCAPAAFYSPRVGREVGERARQWIYNGYLPNTGSFVTDDVAISPRVNPWIQHKYSIPRWFYWEATYYKDVQGGRSHVDVFGNANNFRVGDDDKMNGDGLLMYPGRDRIFKERDLGIDAPLPSIRLKNWRRGIQDVEYLVLLSKIGHGELAKRLVDTLVPSALADETTDGDPVSWPEDGERWLRARRLLFDALVSGSLPDEELAALARPPEATWPKAKRTLKRWLEPLLRSPRRRLAAALGAGTALAALALGLWRLRRRRRRQLSRAAAPE